MNFCPSCGTKLSTEGVFCPNCGTKVAGGQISGPKVIGTSGSSIVKESKLTTDLVMKFAYLFGALVSYMGVIYLVFQKWINVEAFRALRETAENLNIRESLEYQYSLFDVSRLADTFFYKAQKYDYVDYQDIKSLELLSSVLFAVCAAVILVNVLGVVMTFIKRKYSIILAVLTFVLTNVVCIAFYFIIAYVNDYLRTISDLDFDQAMSPTFTPAFMILLSLTALVFKILAYKKTKELNAK